MTFISLLDYSTCFGRFLHPSSGVWQLHMQPLVRVTHWTTTFLQEGGCPMCNSYQGLHIQLSYSWWWVKEAPETCRVVKKWNKSHYPTQVHRVGLFNNLFSSFPQLIDKTLPGPFCVKIDKRSTRLTCDRNKCDKDEKPLLYLKLWFESILEFFLEVLRFSRTNRCPVNIQTRFVCMDDLETTASKLLAVCTL